MPNRLAAELSPYLLQHADNPVDWYAWGPEALERAAAEQKPIFLSIGYSACHWCHVMAHESFEDEGIARQLADGFISVKVDREERPEIDQIYMEAVQAMSGHGGWPLSVFLTPAGRPFFGGTYWPSHARRGMPGFDEILRAVDQAWQTRREQVVAQADQIVGFLHENHYDSEGPAELNGRPIEAAEDALRQSFDAQHGGFGGAPKFPQAMSVSLLLRRWQMSKRDDVLAMVAQTLDAMANGDIYDHLGGGFHRYTVDAQWLVPHFEKMLYDNALLAGCYLDAWQATGADAYAQVVRETLDYLLRDMRSPEGGIYSSEDADSEGEEGKFYVWTPAEVREELGDEAAAAFGRVYDVTERGNFEGRNILHLSRSIEPTAELAASRQRLLAARNRRVRPGRDDKVLVSWNALAIDVLARAGLALYEPRYAEAATKAADFLLTKLRDPSGRLLHCWRGGRAKVDAMLDDYAGLANALTTLAETTGQSAWQQQAVALVDDMLARFADPKGGGFFYTAVDHEPLIARKKDVLDASVPSGNGLAATVLVRLGRLAGRDDYLAAAERTLRAFYDFMRQMPNAAGQMLLALDRFLAPSTGG
jgi:hypothetical protein